MPLPSKRIKKRVLPPPLNFCYNTHMPKDTASQEVLPALDNRLFEGFNFVPITYEDNDKTTTIQDLNLLNTLLECTTQAMPKMRSVLGLQALSNNAINLIKTRRGVKKLPYGCPLNAPAPKGRTIEILED